MLDTEAFAEGGKIMNQSGLSDVQLAYYSPSASCSIYLNGLILFGFFV